LDAVSKKADLQCKNQISQLLKIKMAHRWANAKEVAKKMALARARLFVTDVGTRRPFLAVQARD